MMRFKEIINLLIYLPVTVSQVHRDDVLELNWRTRTHCYPPVLRLEKGKKRNYIAIRRNRHGCKSLELSARLNNESWELGQGFICDNEKDE